MFGLFCDFFLRGSGGGEGVRKVIIARPRVENGRFMLKIPRLPSALGGRFLGVKAAGYITSF